MLRAMPWFVSVMIHAGIGAVALFVVVAVARVRSGDDEGPIVIPQSFTDPALATGTPGGAPHAGEADPTREAAQNKLRDVLKNDGWAKSDSTADLGHLLQGSAAPADLPVIARGSDGLAGGGDVSLYGTPSAGGGSGPRTNFYGTGGNATRIVYIIDRSGTMIDNFPSVLQETIRSVNHLVPLQFFNAVMVSDRATLVGGMYLERATQEAKRDFAAKISQYVAEGKNDDELPPFQDAFEKAFAMKPQLVFFLTDGHFSPQLVDVVERLNQGHRIHINTLAFVTEEEGYKEQLQMLAKINGGEYRFISERDLGK
jgi:hypothetical protein